jgi:hypothetical protein
MSKPSEGGGLAPGAHREAATGRGRGRVALRGHRGVAVVAWAGMHRDRRQNSVGGRAQQYFGPLRRSRRGSRAGDGGDVDVAAPCREVADAGEAGHRGQAAALLLRS